MSHGKRPQVQTKAPWKFCLPPPPTIIEFKPVTEQCFVAPLWTHFLGWERTKKKPGTRACLYAILKFGACPLNRLLSAWSSDGSAATFLGLIWCLWWLLPCFKTAEERAHHLFFCTHSYWSAILPYIMVLRHSSQILHRVFIKFNFELTSLSPVHRHKFADWYDGKMVLPKKGWLFE